MTEKLFDDPVSQSEFELGATSGSQDSTEEDGPDSSFHDNKLTERRALVSQPVDIELDSVYSESERDSMAGSLRPGESPALSLASELKDPSPRYG